MIPKITPPVKGSPMRAQWGIDVSDAVNRLAPSPGRGQLARDGFGGFGFEAVPANLREKRSKSFHHPFEVQWAANIGDGGSWIIYLPKEAYLISLAGTPVAIEESLETAGENYPSGWYTLPEEALSRENGGLLTLKIIPGATPTSTFGSGDTGTEAIEIKICEAFVDTESDTRSVKQFVCSAIHLGSGTQSLPSPFDIDSNQVTDESGVTREVKSIVRCHFNFDGVDRGLPDYPVSIVNGTIYLNATRAAPSEDDETVPEWEFAMSDGCVYPSDGGKAMNIPLYEFLDGEPCVDYRTTFLTLNSPAESYEKSEIEVITDISIYFAAGDLRLTFQKKKVQILGTPEEMESKTVRTSLGSKTIKLLTDVAYNESGDYVFKAKSRNVMVFDADDNDTENDVFATTPHSNE